MASFMLEDIEFESQAEVKECIENKQSFEIIAMGASAIDLKEVLYLTSGDTCTITRKKLKASTFFSIFGITTLELLTDAISNGFNLEATVPENTPDKVIVRCIPS